MKKYFRLLLILWIPFGCETEHKLTFEPLELQGESCKNCPEITINIPHALDESGVATAINRSLREEVIALLSFSENEDIENVDEAMASFTESYKELKTKFPDEIGVHHNGHHIGIFINDFAIYFGLPAYFIGEFGL